MIFRTESLSAGVVDAPPAAIVKTAAKAMVAAFAGLFRKNPRRAADILTLSNHELLDIGLEHGVPGHCTPGAPIAYDLLDLVPRGSLFSHRTPR